MPDQYTLGPVVACRIYRRDVVIERAATAGPLCLPDTKRSEITYLSRESRERLAFVANNTDVVFRTMVTLTYPAQYPSDGKIVKRHLNAFLMFVRRRWSHVEYLWFLEFQKRGAPHIHILLDIELSRCEDERRVDYAAVARCWYRVVGSGDPAHERAGTRLERIRKPDGAARYALKYAYKTAQKTVPPAYRNVGRFWGHSRGVAPTEPPRIEMDETVARRIIADWQYAPHPAVPLYRVLYGVAERFRQHPWISACVDQPDQDIVST